MIKLFSLLSFIFLLNIQAETSEEAFIREKSYLLAQKESLINLKNSIVQSSNNRKKKAEAEIKKIQDEYSNLALKNQELLEEFKAIEKITKDSGQMNVQLEKNYLKISETLSAIAPKIGFRFQESLSTDAVNKFENGLDSALQLIMSLSDSKWRQHAFINEEDKLVKGEILFIGLHSAWGKINGKTYSLAPYNNDFLKVVSQNQNDSTYIFPSDFQKIKILSAKTWKESTADAIPGVVMFIIMIAVFSLFIMLART